MAGKLLEDKAAKNAWHPAEKRQKIAFNEPDAKAIIPELRRVKRAISYQSVYCGMTITRSEDMIKVAALWY